MHTHSDHAPFGRLLRDRRRALRLSQLDLSLQAEVSQRHVSFLESGRARPSREMVLQLAASLDLPMRDRNHWLQSAGYAGIYPQRPLDAADMEPVRAALELMLRHHEPLPAVVCDRAWNLFMANAAVGRVFGLLGDLDAIWNAVCGETPRNLLKLTFHEKGMRPYIVNFDEVARALLAHTAREALTHPRVQDVLDEILRYPDLPADLRRIDLDHRAPPVLPTHFRVHGVDLHLFSMVTTFGTPQDLTTDELRVESFFPADAASDRLLRSLAGSD